MGYQTMADYKRLLLLTGIMVTVCVIVAATMIGVLYQAALERERQRLVNIVQSQTRLMEAMARFNLEYAGKTHQQPQDTLAEVIAAHDILRQQSIGTMEIWLAQRKGDTIIWLTSSRREAVDAPTALAIDSPLAQPMRAAVTGRSGTMIALDYAGRRVLAAYQPVAIPNLNLGLVAKIEVDEIIQRYIEAATIGTFVSLLVIGAGVLLFFRVNQPVIERLRHNEARYRDSESRMRAILETAVDGMITIDPRGTILTANPATERIFGYAVGEMVGNNVNMLMPEPYRSAHDGYLGRYLRTGERRIIGIGREVQGQRKDGSVFPIDLSVGEAIVGGTRIFTGIVRDISERKRTEGDLRAILDHSPALISIKDVKGNIRLASRSFGVLEGPRFERLIGMNIIDLYPPDAADELWRSDLEVLASRQPIETEETLPHRDGTMHTYLTVKFAVYQDDEAFGICNIRTDITERKRAEVEVRKLTQALHQSPISVVITDPTGSIEYVNPKFCDLTGYALDEVIGQNPRILKSGHTSEDEYRALWRTITSGQVWRGEMHNRRKDGTLFWEKASIAPVRDEQGEITHFIALKEDITERKAMEQQLHHTQQLRALGQLTGGIAHDFNNLLAIIIGNLELLSDRLELDPPSKAMLSDALWSAQRGGELTHRLLAFARRQALRPALTDLNQVVRGMSGLLRRTLGTGITVRERLAPDLWNACIDRGELERAIVNLAVNGRDAMGTNGTLTIETRNVHLDEEYAEQYGDVAAGDYAEISIIDTGSGMTPEVLKRVFEPFFTTKEFGKGNGLGLSMVYGFAKQSGGHVSVYSEPGKGTVFHLYLPRAGEVAEVGTGPTPESALRQQFAGLTILIVEDEERLRKVAVKMLSALGLNILEEADGAAALARLSEQPVDLLFADIILQGDMDGIQLAEEARRLRPDLPILFTTGFAERALLEGHRCNGAGWIAKPYSKTELGQAVAALLGGRH